MSYRTTTAAAKQARPGPTAALVWAPMANPSRPPKPSRVPLWYAEYLRGPFLPMSGIVVLGLLMGSYALGLMSERVAALLVAVVFLGACCFYAAKSLSESAPHTWEVGAAVVLGLATLALTFVPVVTALLPGSPPTAGTGAAPGDFFLIPESVRGEARILDHGVPAGHTEAHVRATLRVGSEQLEAHQSRRLESNPAVIDTLTLRGYSVFPHIAVEGAHRDLLPTRAAVSSNPPACPALQSPCGPPVRPATARDRSVA